jgi:hypothetical protein
MTNILYVQTSGINMPERLYSPFILAHSGNGDNSREKGNAEKNQNRTIPEPERSIGTDHKSGSKAHGM